MEKIHGNRKYSLVQDFFETINTEEKAYWLGFLYADGWIHITKKGSKCMGLTLAEKDKTHLEKFRNTICPEKPLYKKLMGEKWFGAGNNYYKLDIYSAKIVDDLISKGITQRKSLTIDFPLSTQVPDCLISHFMRGYFDGDGSIFTTSIPTFSIMGTKEFLEGFLKKSGIPTTKGIYSKRNDGKNSYYLQVRRHPRFLKLGEFLYKDATVFLTRKKEIYDQYKQKCSETTIS